MRKLVLLFSIFVLGQLAHADDAGRLKVNLNADWKFAKGILTNDPALTNYADGSWEIVDVPHCWNSTDAQDGGNNYSRTIGWYRKNIPWDASYEGKNLYIEFLGACLQAECFVNGESVGIHKGGYTVFRFDITSKMTQGDNVIAVKVDNRQSEEIAPLGGDFSVLGGIYRNVSLIVANPVHVDLMDNGASGLYLTPTDVGKENANLEIRSNIVNNSSEPKSVTVHGIIRNPNAFDAIPNVPNPNFDVKAMCPGGDPIQTVSKEIVIAAGDSYLFKESIAVTNPHLWNGKKDPYRYIVDLKIYEGDNLIDSVSDYVGFRYYSVTKEGFFLNGELYPLRGVGKHQDQYNKGYAVTHEDMNEDFGIIYEMGANAIRLAHYPHDPYMYELCDRYGLAVWTEIPLVDRPGVAETFNEVTKGQLRELIRQRYNNPSVFFWGLQNEIRELKDWHGKPLSATYLKTVHNQLSAIFNHAIRYYGLQVNPAQRAGNMGKEERKEMLFWTREEYTKFSDAMMDKPMSFYAFEMLYWCGIREGELLALTPSDFDFQKRTVSITKSYQRIHGQDLITTPKTPKSVRVVQMPQFLCDEIQDYLKQLYGVESNDRIFPITKSYLHREMDRGCKQTGVKRIRIHDLRHSHISLLIDMGFTALAIADRVGHESVDITYRYAHLFPNRQTEMANQLDQLKDKEGA